MYVKMRQNPNIQCFCWRNASLRDCRGCETACPKLSQFISHFCDLYRAKRSQALTLTFCQSRTARCVVVSIGVLNISKDSVYCFLWEVIRCGARKGREGIDLYRVALRFQVYKTLSSGSAVWQHVYQIGICLTISSDSFRFSVLSIITTSCR